MNPARLIVLMGAGVGRGQTWTWNQADLDADIILSNANLTMTAPGLSGGAVRATLSRGAGKVYLEVLVNASVNATMGIGTAGAFIGDAPGAGVGSVGWSANGAVRQAGVSVGPYATYANGDRLGFAFDLTANKLWMAKNNTWQSGDPNSGAGGLAITHDTYFPMGFGQNGTQISVPTVTTYDPPIDFLTF